MSDAEEVKTFWEELENELGEKVIWYSLGELLVPFAGFTKNTVGLFILTDTMFYFQTFPRTDLFKTITNTFRKKKKGGKKVQKGVPRSMIAEAETERPRGLVGRLSASSMPVLNVRFEDGTEIERMRFSLLDKKRGTEFMEIINKDRNEADSTTDQ